MPLAGLFTVKIEDVLKTSLLREFGVSILRVVNTMDHEVVPGPRKNVDWMLNSSRDHFGYTKEKKCQSDHGGHYEIPPKDGSCQGNL